MYLKKYGTYIWVVLLLEFIKMDQLVKDCTLYLQVEIVIRELLIAKATSLKILNIT